MFRGRAEEFCTELASFSESFAKQCRGLSNGLPYIPLTLSVELEWSSPALSHVQKANIASCSIMHTKVDSGLLPSAIFNSSQLGSSGLSDVSTNATHKNLVKFRVVVLCQYLAYRTSLLLSPVNAPCLDSSRFWRSRQTANTASCSMCSS